MEELIREILNSNITWATAAVLIAALLRNVPTALIDLAKTRIETTANLKRDRLKMDQDHAERRFEIDEKGNELLEMLRNELVVSRGIYNQMITGINAIPTTIERTNEITNRAIELAHNDIKSIPAEMWRLGDPKLETIKALFKRYAENLQETIEDSIDPNATAAREIIQQQFSLVIDKQEELARQLSDIEQTLGTFKPKTDPDPPSPKPPKSAIPKLDKAA